MYKVELSVDKQYYSLLFTFVLVIMFIFSGASSTVKAIESTLKPIRSLPVQVIAGEEFDVSITFIADNSINSIGISDEVPDGFTPIVGSQCCFPDTFVVNFNNNIAEFVWLEIETGCSVSVSYKAIVPEHISGTYQFAGSMEYYVNNDGPYFVDIDGDSTINVVSGQIPFSSTAVTVDTPDSEPTIDNDVQDAIVPDFVESIDDILTVSNFINIDMLVVDDSGVIQAPVILTTSDDRVQLSIGSNIRLFDRNDKPQKILTVNSIDNPPHAPAERMILGSCDFGPDGTKFSSPVQITILYDPEKLPRGIAEDWLYLAFWNGTEWIALNTFVDVEASTLSCQVNHFTVFAIISPVTDDTIPELSAVIQKTAPEETEPSSTVKYEDNEAGMELSPQSKQNDEPMQWTTWLIITGIVSTVIIISVILYFKLRRCSY